MWDLRKQIARDREAGKAVIIAEVAAPITSAAIGVALRASDLYLIGIRSGAGQWFEFAPDTNASRPGSPQAGLMLPRSRPVMAGAATALSSYRALRLPEMISTKRASFAGGPIALVDFFAIWDGKLNHDFARLHVCVLIFVICEALRFRQIDNIAFQWTRRAIAADGDWPVFAVTKEMLDLVQSWSGTSDGSDGGLSRGITAWPANKPDRLIT
jgi:hypothetical protein